jgi:exopolyphosphatase/guanosine-5'-triphosphate,3'-diphosphate pyrophosphatase
VSPQTPDSVAAVDLGSNSFHRKVARVIDGGLHTVDRIKEMVRLAAALDHNNNLSKAGTRRA